MTWSGAGGDLVQIFINQQPLAEPTPNLGYYEYMTGNKGKASYALQLCGMTLDRCSAVQTVQY